MEQTYLGSYAPVLIHLLVVGLLAGLLLVLSSAIGQKKPTLTKAMPYECGMIPLGDAREPLNVRFYLVAMIFILFDVEAIFLFPWAVIYRQLRWFGFIEMFLFLVIIFAGYLYAWKKGALDWS
ncbi:MAG: NADH-quinone oxidoreductase subunit A [Acidobacteria bacterium]|nr:NADH-quinone oxidoreductase subunit A [Acidobacteriota bacterium]